MARIDVGRAAPDGSRWIERFARVGFVAKGFLYGIVGTLAACAGMGQGGGTTDTRGAMGTVLGMPFGEVILFAMALGLVGYGLWRIIEGVTDPDQRGSDAKGLALRASFIARGLIHLALAVTAGMLALRMPRTFSFGSGPGGGDTQAQEATATAFAVPGGRWLVLGAAIGIAAFGLYQLYRAFRAKLTKQVSKAEVEEETGEWVIIVSRFGIAARGLVFVVVGWLLARASLAENPDQAGGVEPALDVFAGIGGWASIAIALGLIAYGVYQLLCARYRRIRA